MQRFCATEAGEAIEQGRIHPLVVPDMEVTSNRTTPSARCSCYSAASISERALNPLVWSLEVQAAAAANSALLMKPSLRAGRRKQCSPVRPPQCIVAVVIAELRRRDDFPDCHDHPVGE